MFTEEQRQKLINAAYYIGLACDELKSVNGFFAVSLSGLGGAILNQIEDDETFRNSYDVKVYKEQEISEEVKSLIDEFSDDNDF